MEVLDQKKTNILLNLIKEQDSDILTAIDKIDSYTKDVNEQKYQLLIKRHENAEMKHLNDSKVLKEYSNTIDDVNNNIDNYNPKREQKILIVSDDMIADINTFKKFQSTVEEPFVRCRKLNISLVFMTQSYFLV